MCRAFLFAAALRGPTYPQEAVRRPLAVSSPASCPDQGPEPKPPPSAAAEANHPAAESRAPFCVEEAPKPRAAHHGGRPSQPPPATSSGGVDTWSFQKHVGSTTTSETADIFLIENDDVGLLGAEEDVQLFCERLGVDARVLEYLLVFEPK